MSLECSGCLDPIDGVMIRGWAAPDETEAGAFVDILIDGAPVARLPADAYRGDLDEHGIQQGFAAFFYEVPAMFRDGATHELDVRHSGTDRSLKDAPAAFRIDPEEQPALDGKRRWAARNLVYEGATGARIAGSLRKTRKLAIIGTYHEASGHLSYHRKLMRGLADAGFTVLNVHAADTHRPGLVDTSDPHRFTILKRNIGYDFGSYAVGVFAACDHFGELDEMILMNDSVVQIADDLAPLIARFKAVGADAVACTDSFERSYHLQSYMIWFNAKVLSSGCLQRFMATYSFTSNKDDVIVEGELGLSRMLQAEGFALAALFPYQSVASAWIRRYPATMQAVRDLPGLPVDWPGTCFKKVLLERLDLIMDLLLLGTPLNPNAFFWDVLVDELGYPFIKRELIIANPCNVPTYFKLGSFFPAGSEGFDALSEIRRYYDGRLIVPAICHRDLAAPERGRPAGPVRECGEIAFKLVQRSEAGARMPHLALQDATDWRGDPPLRG